MTRSIRANTGRVELAERGIIFSAAMIQAILAGRKTQTRRLRWGPDHQYLRDQGKPRRENHLTKLKPGDVLWVRENVRAEELASGEDGLRYPADGAWFAIENSPRAAIDWLTLHNYGKRNERPLEGVVVPAIHMPRWASRISLTVDRVWTEPLQAISDHDAEAEGVEYESADPPFYYVPGILPHSLTGVETSEGASASYAKLWSLLHTTPGERWEDDPEVVAIAFSVAVRGL